MIDRNPEDTDKNKRARTIFLAWILGFFALFIVVDIFFWVMADRSHSGVVSDDAYDEGLAYNQTIEAAEAQAKLGWTSDITLNDNQLRFAIEDANGNGIEGAKVRATFVRPTQEGHDFTVSLLDLDGGIYTQVVDLPLEGVWDIRVFVSWKEQQYQQSTRVRTAR